MISDLYITFVFLLLLSGTYRLNFISKYTVLNIVFCVLIYLVVFKDGSIMPDYQVYKDNYYNVAAGNYNIFVEPSYLLISKLFSPLGTYGFYFVLATYGIITLKLHFIILEFNEKDVDFSLILYLSNFFILFTMVQIRAGVALGFIYLAMRSYQSWKKYILYMLCAVFFHYSSLIFLPLIFIRKIKLKNQTIFLILMFSYVFKYGISTVVSYLVSFLPNSYFLNKILIYTMDVRTSLFTINLLNPFIVSKVILLLFFMVVRKKYLAMNKELDTYFKLYFLGIVSYIGLSPFPDIAVRVSNILFFSEIILMVSALHVFKPQYLARLGLVGFCFFMFWFNITHNSYFQYQLV